MKHFDNYFQNNRATSIELIPNSTDSLIGIYDRFHCYSVRFETQSKKIISCDCEQFNQTGYCKHAEIASQIITKTKLNHIQQNDVMDNSLASYFTHLEQLSKSNLLTTPGELNISIDILIVESFSNFSHEFLLALKAGYEKQYVINNIKLFYDAYRLKSIYTLGKNQQIDFSKQFISKNLAKLFKLLEPIVTFSEKNYQYGAKYITIHPLLMRKVLSLSKKLSTITITYQTPLQKYELYPHINEIPLTIKIGKSGEDILINLIPEHRIFIPEAKVLIVNQNIYVLTEEMAQIYQDIEHHFNLNDQFILNELEASRFLSYAIPIWKLIANIQVDGYIHSFLQNRAEPTVTFSEDNDAIVAEINYSTSGLVDRKLDISLNQLLHSFGFNQHENKYYLLNHEIPLIYNFLKNGVREFNEMTNVTFDESLQLLNDVYSPEVSILNQDSIFNVAFNIDGISQFEIQSILNHLIDDTPYVKLNNGQYLDLENETFKPVKNVLQSLSEHNLSIKDKMTINRFQAIHIAHLIDSVNTTQQLQKLIHDLKVPSQFNVNIPKQLNATLKPYQILGFKWLKMLAFHQLGGILADDMGLGKTIQSIAYILSEIEDTLEAKQFLIIAPASLIHNWVHEFTHFAPTVRVSPIYGNKKERISALQNEDTNVFVTSYQSFRQDSDYYSNRLWHTIILDESQYIKNYSTKIHQHLRKLNATVFFALSGTPIENRKEDLWSVFSIILPGLFPNIHAYNRLSNENILKMSRPFILRRLKDDVLKELPEKNEAILYSDLTKLQKMLYMAYLLKMQETFGQMDNRTFKKNRFEILSGITRLRQICNHPGLFLEQYEGQSAKLEQCIELVKRAINSGHRILLFSQFSSMLLLIKEALIKENIIPFLMTGKTPIKERASLVNRFNSGENHVFLISLKAGGTGLNLTGADTVILYDLWWNPAIEEQATSRAHRIGQKQNVQVYRLVSEGTIEEKILALQEKKKSLIDALIFNESSNQTSQLSDDDIKEILGL